MKLFTVAAIQMVSGITLEKNLLRAQELIDQAVAKGAELVLLPEYFCLMGKNDTDKVTIGEQMSHGPIQAMLANAAKKNKIWLIGGTIPLTTTDNTNKVRNTSLVYDPDGTLVKQYDKIHLFRYQGEQENFDESRTLIAGQQIATHTISTPSANLNIGLSICYDLRFPELYRRMSIPNPVDLIVVPAAFTYVTGQAHWEILLRARAIENQCYVLAAAQGGLHENGRRTWGHSMLIDPWGKILAQLDEGEGIVSGYIDLNQIAIIRKNLPALTHQVLLTTPKTTVA